MALGMKFRMFSFIFLVGIGFMMTNPALADGEYSAERAMLEEKTLLFYQALESGEFAQWIAMWSEDGVSRYPFGAGLVPAETKGRDAIYKQRAEAPDIFESASFPVDEVIVDVESGIVITRFRAENVIAGGGGVYRNSYVGLIRFNSDGLVTEYAEYFNPVVLAKTFGMQDQLQ